jgi:hypothetical protein
MVRILLSNGVNTDNHHGVGEAANASGLDETAIYAYFFPRIARL